MHLCKLVSQTNSIWVGLKNILTHRDDFSLVDYERNVLLLPFHSHRKRLGNGDIVFDNLFYIHLLTGQLQRGRLRRALRRSHQSLVQTRIILRLELFKRLDSKSDKRLRNFNTLCGLGIHHPRHQTDLTLTNWN